MKLKKHLARIGSHLNNGQYIGKIAKNVQHYYVTRNICWIYSANLSV